MGTRAADPFVRVLRPDVSFVTISIYPVERVRIICARHSLAFTPRNARQGGKTHRTWTLDALFADAFGWWCAAGILSRQGMQNPRFVLRYHLPTYRLTIPPQKGKLII